MQAQEFLTQEKKESLEKELEFLKTTKRSEILERLAFAKSLGDLSENAEYHTSKESQGKNESRISQIEAILKSAVIIEANTDGSVGLGSIVTLVKENTSQEITYQLVGDEEADFEEAKISYTSPLGEAILNKRPGDKITITTPKGEVTYTIQEVK